MKFTPKDLEIIKAIKANNKAALKRLKKQKDAREALKIFDDYYAKHGTVPRA
jgi:hypothetical protein